MQPVTVQLYSRYKYTYEMHVQRRRIMINWIFFFDRANRENNRKITTVRCINVYLFIACAKILRRRCARFHRVADARPNGIVILTRVVVTAMVLVVFH
jgi:hypothetical protein